ncbi:MAG: hypothetical protein MZV65_28240 [Chromatiales bacterium]|nr:hypothetical protein [Chromatiales bacterium]
MFLFTNLPPNVSRGQRQPAHAQRIEGNDAMPFAPLQGPVAFIGVIADEIVDFLNMVCFNDMAHQLSREYGAN